MEKNGFIEHQCPYNSKVLDKKKKKEKKAKILHNCIKPVHK